jgi:hypothetical protein
MSATFTVNLDSEVLQLAEQEARARHTTLSGVVAQQLRVMARNWQESQAGGTPLTDGLRGAITLPSDFDERAALTEELQKKHFEDGIQYFSAKAEGGVIAIVTRNKADYSASEIPVLLPEFLAKREQKTD